MIEQDCLLTMRTFLAPRLPQPQANLGSVEPVAATDLPALVLSLERSQRLGSGLGDRNAPIRDGALPCTSTIDLANPVLPDDPTVRLLRDDRLELTLPHGGLVRADTTAGTLGPADLTVTVAGSPRSVVATPPAAGEVRCDPTIGSLVFGAPLPLAGNVVVTYFVGQWEQRTARIAGSLRVAVRTASATDTESLSTAVLQTMERGRLGALPGLHRLSLVELGAIGRPDAQFGNSRTRTLLFDFELEITINQPESSGGIIRRIPVTTFLPQADGSRINVTARGDTL